MLPSTILTSTNLMPPGALLESWGPPVGVIFTFFILLGAVPGAVGGSLAFARAKERLRQRLALGALAGALTSLTLLWNSHTLNKVFSNIPTFEPGRLTTLFVFVLCCLVGGYAGADGISMLLKAVGQGK
jgi:hypothetical protein